MKRTRSIVFVHVCVVFAVIAIGLVLMWPWLLGTTVRFTPAQLVVIWLAEALVLIVFLAWAMKALVIEEDASLEREDLKRPDRISWLELFLVLGAVLDIAASYYHDYEW